MQRGMLGLILAGLGVAGIIFTGLTHFSHDGFYGGTGYGMGAFDTLIPAICTIILIVSGLILMFTDKNFKELNK